MNQNLTDLNILVDRSGSMSSIAQSVKDGIRELVRDQKAQDGECNITVAQFDRSGGVAAWNPNPNFLGKDPFLGDFGKPKPESNVVDYLCEGVPLDVVSENVMDGFEPRGTTPFYEALRDFINRIGDRLRCTPEHLRPGKVVVVVQTDGMENSSIGVSQDAVREMIQHQESRYSWQFIFLGANLDAYGEGTRLGFAMDSCLQYAANNVGTAKAYGAVSRSLTSYRAGETVNCTFDPTDQDEQDGEGARPGILGVSS